MLTDIYAASESPIPGITSEALASRHSRRRPQKRSLLPLDAWTAIEFLLREARPGDAIMTIGAGNVSRASNELMVLLGTEHRFTGHHAALKIPNSSRMLPALGVQLLPGTSLPNLPTSESAARPTCSASTKHEAIPALLNLLDATHIPHKFLGGGSNFSSATANFPGSCLQLANPEPEVVLEGNFAQRGRRRRPRSHRDLLRQKRPRRHGRPYRSTRHRRWRAAHECRRLRHADRFSYVREVKVYRAAARKMEILKGDQISFEYRHTSFAPDDMMLSVKLELPSKPFKEILQGIRICNEKRRASQPLGQKSAGCIFKNPPGASAGRMIDELGLKGLSVGDARVSDRHANFFVNAGRPRRRTCSR